MIERLLKKGFGVALWTEGADLFVRVRYRNREVRLDFKSASTTVDEALMQTASKLANQFPETLIF
mgnify:CR=1 FL=1